MELATSDHEHPPYHHSRLGVSVVGSQHSLVIYARDETCLSLYPDAVGSVVQEQPEDDAELLGFKFPKHHHARIHTQTCAPSPSALGPALQHAWRQDGIVDMPDVYFMT